MPRVAARRTAPKRSNSIGPVSRAPEMKSDMFARLGRHGEIGIGGDSGSHRQSSGVQVSKTTPSPSAIRLTYAK